MGTGNMDGKEFVERAGNEYGIVSIPGQAFYGEPVNAVRLSLVSTSWSKGDKDWLNNVDNLENALKSLTS